MKLKYVMKEPKLEMDTHFDTLYYRQQAQKIFSATLGREVEPWEIEVVKKIKKISKTP